MSKRLNHISLIHFYKRCVSGHDFLICQILGDRFIPVLDQANIACFTSTIRVCIICVTDLISLVTQCWIMNLETFNSSVRQERILIQLQSVLLVIQIIHLTYFKFLCDTRMYRLIKSVTKFIHTSCRSESSNVFLVVLDKS